MVYVDEKANWFSMCIGDKSTMAKSLREVLFNHWKEKKVKLKYPLCGVELMRWPE